MLRVLVTRVTALAAGSLLAFSTATLVAQGDPQKKPAPPQPPAKQAAPASGHVMLDAAQLKWGPTPPGLPPGGEVAVVEGDPSKPGVPFALRVKIPDGYTVAPHWHPTAEHLVIFSGTLMMGVGDKVDEASMHALGAGAYSKMPAKTRHYVRAKGETTFQVYGTGPFSITYVNPKDDPRKKTTP
jgi:quercetin dioxygenase-like cupin family protein